MLGGDRDALDHAGHDATGGTQKSVVQVSGSDQVHRLSTRVPKRANLVRMWVRRNKHRARRESTRIGNRDRMIGGLGANSLGEKSAARGGDWVENTLRWVMLGSGGQLRVD